MIVFLISMAASFLVFGAGFVWGVRYGVEQEEGRWRSMDSVTYTDPIIDVYIPVRSQPKVYDWYEEQGRIEERSHGEKWETDVEQLRRDFHDA